MSIFEKDWSAPDPISELARQKMNELLQTGRLHRYQGGPKYVSQAEEEMAKYLGVKYCLGLNSGGSALFLALKLSGVTQGTPVLTNSYTLAPVPGAIRHAGGVPVLGGGTSFFYFGPSVLVCATCGGGRSEAGHCFHLFSFFFLLRLLLFTHFGESPVREIFFLCK